MDEDELKIFEDLQKSAECLVCNKISTSLLISRCEHIFCESCVSTLLKRRIVRCPKCKKNLSKRMFSKNEAISGLISILLAYKSNSNENSEHARETENEPGTESNLVVSNQDIEKYMNEKIKSCQIVVDDDQSDINKNSNINYDQNSQDFIDDFISISQIPNVPPPKRDVSPLRLPRNKIKTQDKVTSWLNYHGTDFLEADPSISTPSNFMEDEIPDKAAVPTFTDAKQYQGPKSKGNAKKTGGLSKESKNKEDGNLSKIDMECAVELKDCFENKHNDVPNKRGVTRRSLTRNKIKQTNEKIVSDSNVNHEKSVDMEVDELNVDKGPIIKQNDDNLKLSNRKYSNEINIDNSRTNIVEENVSSTKDNSLDNLQVKTSVKNSVISKISTNVDQSKDNEVLSGNLFSSAETSTFKFKVSRTTQVIKSDTKKGSISKERKTFSLEANTEDLQNINDNITVNTEDALTLIFNQCNRRPNKLGIEKTALLNSKENIVCRFVKPLNLLPRSFRRSLISNPEPVLFFLKGSLDAPKIVHKDVGMQCTLIKNNKETILKQTANVQTQTEEIQLNFNNASSCNKNATENNLHKTGLVKEINVYKDIRNESQEHNKIEYIGNDLMSNTYTKKCNSSLSENAEDTEDILEVTNDIHKRFNQKSKEKSLSPSYDLPDDTLVAETSKPEILLESDQIENVMGILKEKYSCHDDEFEETTMKNQGDTSKSSKRKREEKEIDEREINIPASGGNTSFSSDSDIQSCLRPVKSVQLPDMSDDEMVMDENMTVKFISMQDSENDDTNIIKKRKVQQLISSGSSSMKENKHNNPLEEDSEPMDYDDILSTVFANIDAELNTGSKEGQDEDLETRKENPQSKVKPNTLNKEYSSNRSPMKQILSKNIQKPAILCSSTPKINSKSNNSAERRSLEISINTLDKTADLDKIVSAIECNYMQKELDTQNQTDILSELQRNMCRSETENEGSQIPQSLFRSSLVKQGPYSKSRRSLIYQDIKQNKSPQIMFKSPKDTLNETISTIVDYPKENSEPFISSLSKTNTEPVEMEISSSLEQHQNRALMQHTFDVREKNVEIVENTEISETRLEPEIDFVPSSMETKPICLACSCLLQDDIILVKNFADRFNLKFVMQYEDSVTHLIVRVNKENCAERSLKFINAMVSGIWVLNKNWISDSLAKKELLPEYKYEVLDISLEPGPKRNRISLPKSLFINIKVFVIGPFHSTSADEFKLLLKNTGVMIQNSHISAQIVVMDDGEHTKEEIEETYKHCTKPIVDMGWFLDCICRGRLVKITEHLLLPDISEINLKNYPSQIFQDTERL